MATWWSSLTRGERDEIMGDLHRGTRRQFGDDYSHEQEAREVYARWFVREHFLAKQLREYEALMIPGDTAVYERAQAQNGLAVPQDLQRSYSWTRSGGVDPSWFVNLTDLEREDPHNSEFADQWWFNEARQSYLFAKNAHLVRETLRYLTAEAEYQRVHHEALVRSYGVDVKAP